MSAGALSYLATVGGACIASPFIKVAGALIAVGSVVYLISKYFT